MNIWDQYIKSNSRIKQNAPLEAKQAYFIFKANKKYKNFYDYSLVKFKTNRTPIKIICPDHGIFEQKPIDHLTAKKGCQKCGSEENINNIQNTFNNIIENSNTVHNNEYSYIGSESNKNGTIVRLTVNCSKHGKFTPLVRDHLRGTKCPQCANTTRAKSKTLSLTEILSRIEKHPKRSEFEYPYIREEYVNKSSSITIVCQKHGKFKQTIVNHIDAHAGCPECANENKFKGYDEDYFLENPDENGMLYILKMSGNNENFIKVGITKHNVKIRYSTLTEYNIDEVIEVPMKLYSAFKLENSILLENKINRYRPKKNFGGHTECFNITLLAKLKSKLQGK